MFEMYLIRKATSYFKNKYPLSGFELTRTCHTTNRGKELKIEYMCSLSVGNIHILKYAPTIHKAIDEVKEALQKAENEEEEYLLSIKN